MKFRSLLLLAITALVSGLLLVAPGEVSAITEAQILAKMAEVNDQLAARGENVRLAEVEYYTAKDEVGKTVFFFDRTLQAAAHWVPNDPRRYGVAEIYWLSDQTEGMANGLTLGETQSALAEAMDTWDSVTCASIPLVQWPDYSVDWGYVQYLLGFGGIPGWLADITHAGWLPGDFFDAAFEDPDASDVVLGVTFTFVWASSGVPTDIDNNGKLDVAFREVYYNNAFTWGINPNGPIIDVESIVLHETGHGLSLGHFGTLFRTDKNGKFHFAPRAVMNAGYTGVQQDLAGTDNASFCSVWGGWPVYD